MRMGEKRLYDEDGTDEESPSEEKSDFFPIVMKSPVKKVKRCQDSMLGSFFSPSCVNCPLTPCTPPRSVVSSSALPHSSSFPTISTARVNIDFCDIAPVGNGSFGSIYKVRNRLTGLEYAVKRSNTQCKSDSSSKHRALMLQEVKIMALLAEVSDSTAAIVRYYSSWIEDDHVYIQMELCDTSLDQQLSNPAIVFTASRVLGLFRDMSLGLRVLHSHSFVHLDVKPANILYKEGRYKLCDFGKAVHVNCDDGSNSAVTEGEVEEGDCRYMPKELMNWNPSIILSKCDIFSLGITLYEVVTRSPLPLNGPEWQRLRSGANILNEPVFASPVVGSTANSSSSSFPSKLSLPLHATSAVLPASFKDIVLAMVDPIGANRPSADDLLELFSVTAPVPLVLTLESANQFILDLLPFNNKNNKNNSNNNKGSSSSSSNNNFAASSGAYTSRTDTSSSSTLQQHQSKNNQKSPHKTVKLSTKKGVSGGSPIMVVSSPKFSLSRRTRSCSLSL